MKMIGIRALIKGNPFKPLQTSGGRKIKDSKRTRNKKENRFKTEIHDMKYYCTLVLGIFFLESGGALCSVEHWSCQRALTAATTKLHNLILYRMSERAEFSRGQIVGNSREGGDSEHHAPIKRYIIVSRKV